MNLHDVSMAMLKKAIDTRLYRIPTPLVRGGFTRSQIEAYLVDNGYIEITDEVSKKFKLLRNI